LLFGVGRRHDHGQIGGAPRRRRRIRGRAEFDLAFNPTLEEAIQKGVPLYFVFEFELSRPRWYWVD
jgi:hypothetical protein